MSPSSLCNARFGHDIGLRDSTIPHIVEGKYHGGPACPRCRRRCRHFKRRPPVMKRILVIAAVVGAFFFSIAQSPALPSPARLAGGPPPPCGGINIPPCNGLRY